MEDKHFDKIIGISDEHAHQAEEVSSFISQIANQEGSKKIDGLEIEKTKHDIEIINFASSGVDEIMAEYGRKAPKISLDKVHILKLGGVSKDSKGAQEQGAHNPINGNVVVDRAELDVNFCLTTFHELFHAKSYLSLRINEDLEEGHQLFPHKMGFSVIQRNGTTQYFKDFLEAVTAIAERKFFEKIKTNPIFTEELEKLEKEEKLPEFSRNDEVAKMNFLIDDIFAKNSLKFKSRNDVLEIFMNTGIKSSFSELAHLMEDTYGKGSFKKFALENKEELDINL